MPQCLTFKSILVNYTQIFMFACQTIYPLCHLYNPWIDFKIHDYLTKSFTVFAIWFPIQSISNTSHLGLYPQHCFLLPKAIKKLANYFILKLLSLMSSSSLALLLFWLSISHFRWNWTLIWKVSLSICFFKTAVIRTLWTRAED